MESHIPHGIPRLLRYMKYQRLRAPWSNKLVKIILSTAANTGLTNCYHTKMIYWLELYLVTGVMWIRDDIAKASRKQLLHYYVYYSWSQYLNTHQSVICRLSAEENSRSAYGYQHFHKPIRNLGHLIASINIWQRWICTSGFIRPIQRCYPIVKFEWIYRNI